MRLVGSAEALSVVARRSLPLGSFYRAFLHRSRLVGAARSVATRRRATPWLADGQRDSVWRISVEGAVRGLPRYLPDGQWRAMLV